MQCREYIEYLSVELGLHTVFKAGYPGVLFFVVGIYILCVCLGWVVGSLFLSIFSLHGVLCVHV